ncbi:MAG: hypothetical protein KDI31_13600, partial [Pseudomonadales bacterium]|nr:hypothetical protein [Pseudomonadales bacterium]
MDQLVTFAAMAEIFGALAILAGGLFAIVQFSEFRKRRRYQVAAELCRQFADPDFARAIVLIRQLPDGISLEALKDLDSEYEQSAQVLAMTFE